MTATTTTKMIYLQILRETNALERKPVVRFFDVPGLLVIQVRLRYLEREQETLKYFPPLTKKRKEKTGGCFNTLGGEEQGLNCESLEQGVELRWPLTERKETLGDTSGFWA